MKFILRIESKSGKETGLYKTTMIYCKIMINVANTYGGGGVLLT